MGKIHSSEPSWPFVSLAGNAVPRQHHDTLRRIGCSSSMFHFEILPVSKTQNLNFTRNVLDDTARVSENGLQLQRRPERSPQLAFNPDGAKFPCFYP